MPTTEKTDETKLGQAWLVAKFSSVGIEIGLAILIGWWVGQRLDTRWGTSPWCMIVGFTVGAIAAFRGLMRSAQEASEKMKDAGEA